MPKPVILVVEDDLGVRDMLETMIPHLGYEVKVATTGKEAIHYYQHGQRFDLVLLDVRMPDLDGPQTLLEIKKFDPAVTCCFMTGNSGQYTREELMRFGAVLIIEKPFSASDLDAAIAEYIRKPVKPEVA